MPISIEAMFIEKRTIFDRAIADYTKAIEFKPNNTIAHYYRGLVYIIKGELDRASKISPKQ